MLSQIRLKSIHHKTGHRKSTRLRIALSSRPQFGVFVPHVHDLVETHMDIFAGHVDPYGSTC